jgi:transglutaminase-like putative cysteine protease
MSETARSDALRLAVFAALAAFAAAHWAALVTNPPVGRTVLCVLVIAAGAGALIAVGRAPLGPATRSLLAALAAVAAFVAALLAVGMPARLLVPAHWDQLGHAVRSGLAGIEDVDYPYAGDHPWSRLVIMLALPLSLGAAMALAFWPAKARARPLRALALAIVVGIYATAVITDGAGHPLLRGLALFLLLAAWLWLPGLPRRQALACGAFVAIAGAAAVPLASALDADNPWLDYRDWSIELGGGGGSETFSWNHTYGPFDWPRTGKRLLEVRSDSPHYWRVAVLDSFDGVGWRSSQDSKLQFLELPSQLAGRGAVWKGLDPSWIHWNHFIVDSLSSPLAVSAGPVQSVKGIDLTLGPTGVAPRDGALEEGDSYSLRTYVPDPSAEQMRDARPRYAPPLAAFTTIELRRPRAPERVPGTRLTVPLRGDPRGGPEAARRLARSPYAAVYALARRWTSGSPTAYDAVEAVENHLQRSYQYSENPPRHPYPLRAFLLADRAGYCQQFSGAMALMLRMIGIPSRVAAGFGPGERSGDRFVVRDYDAHSWVEVYFNGIGWVTFDPTPAAAPVQSQAFGPRGLGIPGAGGGAAAKSKPARAGRSAPPRAAGGSPGGMPFWIIPAGVVLVLLAAAAVPIVIRRRRCRSLSEAELAEAQLRELEAALRRLDRPVGRGTTLRALERRLGRRRLAVKEYVAKLRAVRYEPRDSKPPTLAERSRMRRELSSGRGVGARLRGLLCIPPGGPAVPIR